MKPVSRMDRPGPLWLLVLIILAGAFLRFYRLDAQSFWGDEAFSAVITARGLDDVLDNPFSVNPPGYFLLLNLWRSVAGDSDFALRFVSALFGVLGVALTFQLGQSVCSRRLGIWAASLTALSPFYIFYSQEARMYAQLHAVACVLMLAYVRLWLSGRRAWWLVISLSSIAALGTHFFAGFALAVLGAHFSLMKLWPGKSCLLRRRLPGGRGSSPTWLGFLTANGSVALLCALYGRRFITQVQLYNSEIWHWAPSGAELLSLSLTLTGGPFLNADGQTLGFALTTFTAIVVGMQVIREIWQRKPTADWVTLLALFCVLPPVIAFLMGRLWKLVFAARIMIISVPAYHLLLAWGATHTRERGFNKLLVIAMTALMGWGLHNWYFDPSFAKPPIRDAARQVEEFDLKGTGVLHGTGTSYRLFEHYAPEVENYLVFPVHSLDFQRAQRHRLDAGFDRAYEWSKDGIRLYYYVRQDR